MRQFIVSAGRIFNNRALFAVRAEKIGNKGKAGFGSDTKPVEMPIVERIREKGADRQASHHEQGQAMGNANLKSSLQSDMNAGIGINQSNATADKKWTENSNDKNSSSSGKGSKNKNQEQMARDIASGKNDQQSGKGAQGGQSGQDGQGAQGLQGGQGNQAGQSGTSKDSKDKAQREKRADERAAIFPNMPQETAKNREMAKEKQHDETDKITEVINEEHGLKEVGDKKKKNLNPETTGLHEQHGAHLGGDDMVSHQPKTRFDPSKSAAENAAKFSEEQSRMSKSSKKGDGKADTMKDKAGAAADWMKEKLGAESVQKSVDSKKDKAEGKQEASETSGKVQPTMMRGEFGIPSGSPVGAIKNPEKRSTEKKSEYDAKH